MLERGADAVFLAAPPDLRWATGFSGSSGLLVLTRTRSALVTDGRYLAQAQDEAATVEVLGGTADLLAVVHDVGLLADAHRVLYDAERVTVGTLRRWRERFPQPEWVPAEDLTASLRMAKDAEEVAAIRRALALTEAVFDSLLGRIVPGVTEREVAAEAVYLHLRGGASAMAFEPIVASGPRAALPHARPSDRRLEPGDLVVIDLGGLLDGYASDFTRTVALGRPSDDALRAHAAVREALERATEALRAGISGRDADAVARGVLAQHGLSEYFAHGLGHGLGLEVHEPPRLSPQGEHRVPAGAVVTLEPGVYLPGRFGVRIEDLAHVRDDGAGVLTQASRDLIVL